MSDPREQAVLAPPEPTDARTVCARCQEPVYFVPGLRDDDRWKHARTGRVECAPRCKVCQSPASTRVGHNTVGGYGLAFVTDYWLCDLHADDPLLIERV